MIISRTLPPSTPEPPAPADPVEAGRVAHTRLRRRMIDGLWQQDLRQRVADQVGTVRQDGWGQEDLSGNPYRVINRALSVLYHAPPLVWHPADTSLSRGPIDASLLWAGQSRVQTWALGCREYLVRPVVSDGRVSYRPVPPDMVEAASWENTPAQPYRVSELRHRTIGAHRVWTVDEVDLSDLDRPVYRVREVDAAGTRGRDITDQVYPGGWPIPRWADGRPIMPYIVYHAEHVGDRLFDPYEGIETVEGSLNLAVLLSFFLHVSRDASWPQRYAAGVRVAGLDISMASEAVRQKVVTDPSTLLMLDILAEDEGGRGQPLIGQWQAGGDPATLLSAIESYAARLGTDAGISDTDTQRVAANPRSGYAISLTNEGKRSAQARYMQQFRPSDELLIGTTAAMLNSDGGTSYPEEGYAVLYQQIPLSADELRGRREHVLELLSAGLMSRREAYAHMHPGVPDEMIDQQLAAIDAEKAPDKGDIDAE